MDLQNQHEYVARVIMATPMDAVELQVASTWLLVKECTILLDVLTQYPNSGHHK